MTIGLILLAIAAILIFFGVTERFFRTLGLSNWLAFLLVLAMVIGAVVPSFTIYGVVTINLGGFVVPLSIMVVLMVIMKTKGEVVRTLFAFIAVAAVATATRMLIEPFSGGMILAASLIVGLVGGIAAFLVGQSRLSTIAASLGGIILGDVITGILYRFVVGGYDFTLGSYGVFDSLVIASVFGTALFEVVSAIKKTAHGRFSVRTHRDRQAAMIESAEEISVKTGDDDTQRELSSVEVQTLTPSDPVAGGKNMGDENFFDDFI